MTLQTSPYLPGENGVFGDVLNATHRCVHTKSDPYSFTNSTALFAVTVPGLMHAVGGIVSAATCEIA